MKIIHLINGPNLNLLGRREPSIYGNLSFEVYFEELKKSNPSVKLTYFQSNNEGALMDYLHQYGFIDDGIILNAGAYTHTSLAIADAIKAIQTPVIEVHISNVFTREELRHHSLIGSSCIGTIGGFGLFSYQLAIDAFLGLATLA